MILIERVARAIWQESVGPAEWPDWDKWPPNAWGRVRSLAQARAAIAAIREPTEAMIKIGDDYTHCGGSCGNRAGRDTWQAMIDAALTSRRLPSSAPTHRQRP